MKIIDLSHNIENNMPAWPGDEPPFIQKVSTHDKDKVQVTGLSMTTHSGTHIDTPRHFFQSGATTDLMDINNFYGKGTLIDCSWFGQQAEIPLDHVFNYRKRLENADFALIYTGWDRHWAKPRYFDHFPVLSVDAVRFITDCKIKGIGLDFPSIDDIGSKTYPNHNHVLGNGMIIIENLTNLSELIDEPFQFAAFPLKIREGDGSPVRAVAFVETNQKEN